MKRLVAQAAVAIVLVGCGLGATHDTAIGTFDGGKMIALDEWIGTNTSQAWTDLDSYADVPDQTPGTLDINGPQHWRCVGVFTKQLNPPGGSGFFENDQQKRQDQARTLPKMVGGFAGPHGSYLITIIVPSFTAKFSHRWTFGEAVYTSVGTYDLNENIAECAPIADTLAQQRSINDSIVTSLRNVLSPLSESPIRSQLQTLLDQASQAMLSGDAETNPDQRATYYRAAVGSLSTMVQVAAGAVPAWNGSKWLPLSRGDIANIEKFAAYAQAVLSEAGLH